MKSPKKSLNPLEILSIGFQICGNIGFGAGCLPLTGILVFAAPDKFWWFLQFY